MKIILSFLAIFVCCGCLMAQNPLFSRIEENGLWQNVAYPTHIYPSAVLDYRSSSNYGGQSAYRVGGLLVNAPIKAKGQGRDSLKRNFFTALVGGSFNSSNTGILSTNQALIGLSYSLALDATQSLRLAAGFSGTVNNTRLNQNGTYLQDQFDAYGFISNSVSSLVISKSDYGFFALSGGLSISKTTQKISWYGGLSMQNINRPKTNFLANQPYQIPLNTGLQLGAKYQLTQQSEVKFASSFNWVGSSKDHIANLEYLRNFEGYGYKLALGFGLGYRFNTSLFPSIILKYKKSDFAILYENAGRNTINTTTFELLLKQSF